VASSNNDFATKSEVLPVFYPSLRLAEIAQYSDQPPAWIAVGFLQEKEIPCPQGPDRLWGPHIFLGSGYHLHPGAEVKNEWSSASTSYAVLSLISTALYFSLPFASCKERLRSFVCGRWRT